MSRIFIGVGSNEGERIEYISKAIRALGATSGIRLMQMATIVETEPIGGPPQGPYLNTVVELETAREPADLLSVLQDIERRMGRTPSMQRWAPRPIDLDILLYDDRVIQAPTLSIPHPRMHERRFVLEPLAQLAPEFIHPVLHLSISRLLTRLPDSSLTR